MSAQEKKRNRSQRRGTPGLGIPLGVLSYTEGDSSRPESRRKRNTWLGRAKASVLERQDHVIKGNWSEGSLGKSGMLWVSLVNLDREGDEGSLRRKKGREEITERKGAT